MKFDIMTAAIVVVACFARFIFTLESAIAILLLLGEFCGVPILIINLILGLLLLVSLMIAPNRHAYTFSLPPSSFLW